MEVRSADLRPAAVRDRPADPAGLPGGAVPRRARHHVPADERGHVRPSRPGRPAHRDSGGRSPRHARPADRPHRRAAHPAVRLGPLASPGGPGGSALFSPYALFSSQRHASARAACSVPAGRSGAWPRRRIHGRRNSAGRRSRKAWMPSWASGLANSRADIRDHLGCSLLRSAAGALVKDLLRLRRRCSMVCLI